jgi:predicted dithiol-disulfide oxidoreductase (DUF899 family)
MLLDADHYLDVTPEGRNEGAYPNWPRRHDEYPSDAGKPVQLRGGKTPA